MNNNNMDNVSLKKYRSLFHCCSRSHNVYKSTVKKPEQDAEYFQN